MSGYTVRVRGGGGYIAREFCCADHGVFDTLVQRGLEEPQPCPVCEAPSEPVISAVLGRVKLGEVSRGKVEAPPNPYALDTRLLGEGMPLSEFRKQRKKLWTEKKRKDWKDKGIA